MCIGDNHGTVLEFVFKTMDCLNIPILELTGSELKIKADNRETFEIPLYKIKCRNNRNGLKKVTYRAKQLL